VKASRNEQKGLSMNINKFDEKMNEMLDSENLLILFRQDAQSVSFVVSP
jgi:uncharacterized FlaG/YvyC family protein